MQAAHQPTSQPTVNELTRLILKNPAADLPVSEVEPYHQALPHQWIDPRVLWPDAIAAARMLLPPAEASEFASERMPMSTTWAKRLGEMENARLISCALGNVPALLRDATPLLNRGLAALQQVAAVVPASAAAPADTLESLSLAQRVLSAAQDRLDGRLADAARKLEALIAEAPESWRSLLENETATVLWSQRQYQEAEQIWNDSSASFSPVFQFNRAVAALRRGDASAARPLLQSSIAAFSESGGWRHLAQFYLTLIEMS